LGDLPGVPKAPTLVVSDAIDARLKPHIQGEAAKDDPDNELFLVSTLLDLELRELANLLRFV
jgi:hypothetical protein